MHNQDNTELKSIYPEIDLSNPNKDPESWPVKSQQGDNNGPNEPQLGQFDPGQLMQHE